MRGAPIALVRSMERALADPPMATRHAPVQHILCAVTFSPPARSVVNWAAAFARRDNAEVRLFHAMPASNKPAPIEGEFSSERLLRKLSTMGDPLPGRPRISVAVTAGDAATEILRHARMVDTDIIAIGMHARDGSVSPLIPRIAINAPCPVLVVDDTAPNPPPSTRVLNQVIAAVNFLPASLAAAEYAFAFAQFAGATVTTVHVLPEHWDGPRRVDANLDETRHLVEQHFRQLLEIAVSDVSASSRGRTSLIVSGRPCLEIARVAEARSADLIVMGIDRKTSKESFGETTRCVMQFAHRNVLLVPEGLFAAPRLGRRSRRERPH
jgi:nucleotide-binding universal stress UspA family protein